MDSNEAPAVDEETRPDEETGAGVPKGAPDETKGNGPLAEPLAALWNQAKYITNSLDNTIATLLKLREGIRDTSVKIKQNQETLAKSVESLQDTLRNISAQRQASYDKITNMIEAQKSVDDRVYTAGEGSKISQVGEGPRISEVGEGSEE